MGVPFFGTLFLFLLQTEVSNPTIGLDTFFYSLNRRCAMKRWMVAVVLLLGMTYVGMAIAEEAKSPLERQ